MSTHEALPQFCQLVKNLKNGNAEKALAILWFHDRSQPDIAMSSGQLTKILDDYHVGRPNSTQLAEGIRKSRLASETAAGFSLKPGSRITIRKWLPQQIDGIQPEIDQATGYIPEAVWSGTRGYVESVAKQLNGCFSAAYYDAASVMLRRLVETLIIEAYEHLRRENEIKDNDGNYLMLGELVQRSLGNAASSKGLNLCRNTKKALEEIKRLGDLSAHNRRFMACAADLEKIEPGARVVIGELITIACSKKAAK